MSRRRGRRSLLLASAALVLAAASVASLPAAAARREGVGASRPPLVAFTFVREPEPGAYESAIAVARADGAGGFRRLTEACTDCASSARWSPDGSRLAYVGIREDELFGVFVMKGDGTGVRQLCGGDCWNNAVAWSPDGRRVAVALEEPAGIGLVDVERPRIRRIPGLRLPSSIANIDWSPDGRRLAFGDNGNRVWVVNPVGRKARVLKRGAYYPRWSPDGRSILVTSEDGDAISAVPAGGGPATLIRALPHGRTTFSAAWSPDGTKIVYGTERCELYVIDLRSAQERRIRLPVTGRGWCRDLDWRP